MIEKITWESFRDNGFLWWVNRILHFFGIAIVFDFDKDGILKEVYPVKCRFRGFDNESETEGFRKVTNYVSDNIEEIIKDINK